MTKKMTITIIGSGMMGSALAFPARENGNTVRLFGTPLDREIIGTCRNTNRHPKLKNDFPPDCTFYQIVVFCGKDIETLGMFKGAIQ
jgi:glycerol-3-phosphate dehydrogenase (NAD(P)+)